MKRYLIPAAAAIAFLGSACTPETETDEAPDAAELEEPAAVQPAPTGTETGSAMLAVATLEGAGAYLTDASGRALYLLEGESDDESRCYDACAAEWPPFLAQSSAAPGTNAPGTNAPGLQADRIGTLERTDGTTQVTYDGHPLYYYHDDTEPGQTNGQDVTDDWGEWYLVTPDGEPLEAEQTESTPEN